MSETRAILAAADALRARGTPFLVATVVRVHGSSYRRPGARMLLTEGRWVAGSVSGGCLEGDVLKKGFWRTREAEAALVTYDSRAEDEVRWGFGLGCDGVVDVLLERAPVSAAGEGSTRVDALRFLGDCLRAQARGALVTVFRSDAPGARVGSRVAMHATGAVETDVTDGALRAWMTDEARAALVTGVSSVRSAAGADVFVELVSPPPRLFVLGAGHDAVPVVQIARTVGWDAVVCEPHARWATRERFADADELLALDDTALAARIDAACRPMAIVMGHSYEQDRARLAMLLRTRVEYIGVLGPRRRTDRMLGEIGGDAIGDPRIHAPVGLALGAETPQEIALAIVAEMQSVLTRATAASLRARRGPIHAEEEAAE